MVYLKMSTLNQDIQKVIRVLKHRNLLDTSNNQELAKLSGVNVKTIHRNKSLRDQYAKIAPTPTTNDELSVDKKLVDNYIQVAMNNTKKSKYYYSNILGAVAGYILRQETNLIQHVNQPIKVIKIGLAFMRLSSQILARKDTSSGTPIHSKSNDAKYLLNEGNKVSFVDILFIRSNNYSSGSYSKNWKLSKKSEEIIDKVIDKVMQGIISNVLVLPPHIGGYICNNKSGTYPDCVTIPLATLANFSLPSILHVLNHSEPSNTPNSIEVTLNNLSSTDESIGRNYNIFTRLKSEERNKLGYINYDISGGIQIIAFSILYKNSDDENLFEKYPMLFQYGYNPKYKQNLRDTISSTLSIPVNEVKALLTAYANGSTKNKDKHLDLQQFAEESDLLRREVISITKQCNPHVLDLAIEQSKKEFPDDMDWMSTEEKDSNVSRDKASVFFFIWTYYEKQIRDAMLSVVNDGIPVHDAIYSKQQISLDVFEKSILDQTGFEVKIST